MSTNPKKEPQSESVAVNYRTRFQQRFSAEKMSPVSIVEQESGMNLNAYYQWLLKRGDIDNINARAKNTYGISRAEALEMLKLGKTYRADTDAVDVLEKRRVMHEQAQELMRARAKAEYEAKFEEYAKQNGYVKQSDVKQSDVNVGPVTEPVQAGEQ